MRFDVLGASQDDYDEDYDDDDDEDGEDDGDCVEGEYEYGRK